LRHPHPTLTPTGEGVSGKAAVVPRSRGGFSPIALVLVLTEERIWRDAYRVRQLAHRARPGLMFAGLNPVDRVKRHARQRREIAQCQRPP
jgi:hypothetical protein